MRNDKINELLSLALTTKEIQHAFKRFMADSNLDIPIESLGILLTIHYSNTDAIQQDIADIVKKDKSAVLRQIDNLEKKNLVQRIIDPNDRRKNIIRTTEEGINLIDEINIRLDELYSLLSFGVEASDLKTFIRVLNHFRSKARKL